MTPEQVAARVDEVRGRVAAACAAADRSPASVLLITVTKTHPPSVARTAVAAGLVDLGENRVEELLAKAPLVEGARWHLIGQLQRRKARDVVGRQVLVHGVDRRSLADALSRRAQDAGTLQRVLVQVNVGDDPAKAGCGVADALDLVAYARQLPNLTVEGLMTVPPMPPDGGDANAVARPHFARLRELRDDARSRFPEVVHLSMGMSADLEAAVTEGATMVRVGTAILGPRGDRAWRPSDDPDHDPTDDPA
ncbi:YggS family pyridoxal phosphate-dependent enzyme [Nitriliruptor alkaliphilus]|uniref:YggS family pyridoxal phosphate-dependent enzyme n=1 Tax=Nitriliruptor alkaliphilus TaxID=427918 RepID=UPI0009F9E9E0|nr:YggS family pyridoxal phosphate-dependent enzyme [Nitriliruptor alkaliphilus]